MCFYMCSSTVCACRTVAAASKRQQGLSLVQWCVWALTFADSISQMFSLASAVAGTFIQALPSQSGSTGFQTLQQQTTAAAAKTVAVGCLNVGASRHHSIWLLRRQQQRRLVHPAISCTLNRCGSCVLQAADGSKRRCSCSSSRLVVPSLHLTSITNNLFCCVLAVVLLLTLRC